MRFWIAFLVLSGCVQIQLDSPLHVELEGLHEGEILHQQTFACNIDVALDAEIVSGTIHLFVDDGITTLHDETFNGTAEFRSNYQRAAPVQVTLTMQDFNGTMDFSVKCS